MKKLIGRRQDYVFLTSLIPSPPNINLAEIFTPDTMSLGEGALFIEVLNNNFCFCQNVCH